MKEVLEDKILQEIIWNYQKGIITESKIVDGLKNIIKNIKTQEEAESVLVKLLDRISNLPKKSKVYIIALFFILSSGIISFSSAESKIPDDIRDEVKKELIVSSGVESSIPREITPELIDFITYEEGSAKEKRQPVLEPYKLGDKKVTVGYGHTEPENKSTLKKIRPVNALVYLKGDLEEAKGGLNRILDSWRKKDINPDIDQAKYNAMVSMIFNMGIGNFRTSKFIQLVKQNKMEEASSEILKTAISYGDNEESNGLKKRRALEKRMFDGELDISKYLKETVIRKYIQKILSEFATVQADLLPDLKIDPDWRVPQVGSKNFGYEVQNGRIIFDNPHDPNELYDFVINQQGEMYIGIGHYKMSKKADLIKAAGSLKVDKNGKVYYIDNTSGHYRPDKRNLRAVFNVLKSMGVLSDKVKVNYKY